MLLLLHVAFTAASVCCNAVGAVVVTIPFDVHAVAVADAFTAVLAADSFFVPMILNSVQLNSRLP